MFIDMMIYMLAGVASGVIAGLFGVGGGMIIVPVLLFVFAQKGFSEGLSIHMAIATSLAIIVATASSSIKGHLKKGAVRLDILKKMSVGLFIGAFIGAYIAKALPHEWLKFVIALFALYVGIDMMIKNKKQNKQPHSVEQPESLPTAVAQSIAGSIIGVFSAIFGIGGGTLTVPYLTHYHVKMQQAVGTAGACGLPIAFAGALGFIVFGQNVEELPPYALGYVYLPAFVGFVLTSVFSARLGVKLAHALPASQLKTIFGVFLCVVGIYFLYQSHIWTKFFTLV